MRRHGYKLNKQHSQNAESVNGMKIITTTQEYFNMTAEELQEIRNEYGYTKEECKLLDAAVKVSFLNSIEDIADNIKYTVEILRMECINILSMIDGRIAILYN